MLGLAKRYKVRPSTFFQLDEYTAYCFDEACAYIMQKLEDGEQMNIKKKYTSFKDLYKNYK